MTVRKSLACACLALGTAAFSPVLAQTASPGADPPAASAAGSALFANPVGAETLSGIRGGAQVHNSMTLDGTTADNSAYEVTTGTNTIGTGSFSNMSGLPIVIQNSGANVLIQNAVILNLQMN
ncbi:MAG: hypothetical protein JSS56_03860 [Proteobacteria bacterium]|nr:hypothetical protein [Pseudomonadota bacterium]